MKTSCHITGKIQRDANGNIFCQNILFPHVASSYVGYTCTINEISNNLKIEETPEYPYFCLCPSSIDVQIPATIARDKEGNLLGGKYRLSDRQELAEGSNIIIRKVRPVFKSGADIWGTILQYDINPQGDNTQNEQNVNGPSIDDFKFVLDAGYEVIYSYFEPAMKYYYSDPGQSCLNFRPVLKLTIVEAERITKFTTNSGLKKKIDNLCSYLSEIGLIDDEIILELNSVKKLGDRWMHKEDSVINPDKYKDLTPKKDRYTFYCAFQKIFRWLVALPENYDAFIRAREEKKARLQAEKARLRQEAKEREEAEKRALEELKKQEAAEQKRLERNARARERRRLEREAKEQALRLAAKKAEEEAKAAEKEAKKQLRKIKWQKGVEKVKKILPWVGYGVVTVVSGVAVGASVAAISEAVKKSKS